MRITDRSLVPSEQPNAHKGTKMFPLPVFLEKNNIGSLLDFVLEEKEGFLILRYVFMTGPEPRMIIGSQEPKTTSHKELALKFAHTTERARVFGAILTINCNLGENDFVLKLSEKSGTLQTEPTDSELAQAVTYLVDLLKELCVAPPPIDDTVKGERKISFTRRVA